MARKGKISRKTKETSISVEVNIDGLCMYTIKNIWLEKEKYLEKQKKPASMLK